MDCPESSCQKEGLTLENFHLTLGPWKVLHSVDFSVPLGSKVGLVGESGSGKTLTAYASLGLLDKKFSRKSGRILWKGQPLWDEHNYNWEGVRGRGMSVVFQEPMTTLNPLWKIGRQIEEVFKIHEPTLSSREAWEKTLEILRDMRIPDPSRKAQQYPHELSGGMRQRVLLAIALSASPQLLIADEPTTALDATLQSELLELMNQKVETHHMSLLLISHNLGVIARTCHTICVMYAGQIVEKGPTQEVLTHPAHPYTKGLLASLPLLSAIFPKKQVLYTMPGQIPDLEERPEIGCLFAPRCPQAQKSCQNSPPMMEKNQRTVRCWFPHDGEVSHGS